MPTKREMGKRHDEDEVLKGDTGRIESALTFSSRPPQKALEDCFYYIPSRLPKRAFVQGVGYTVFSL